MMERREGMEWGKDVSEMIRMGLSDYVEKSII